VDDRRFGSITKLRKKKDHPDESKKSESKCGTKISNFSLEILRIFSQRNRNCTEKIGLLCISNLFWAKFHSVQPKKKALATTSSKVFWGKKWLTVTTH
jgi:hypothetical protein